MELGRGRVFMMLIWWSVVVHICPWTRTTLKAAASVNGPASAVPSELELMTPGPSWVMGSAAPFAPAKKAPRYNSEVKMTTVFKSQQTFHFEFQAVHTANFKDFHPFYSGPLTRHHSLKTLNFEVRKCLLWSTAECESRFS